MLVRLFKLKWIVCCLLTSLLFKNNIKAQSYHSISSSPYAGVSNIYINPASSVNSFYKWDACLMGLQFTTSQNTFLIKNTSLTNPGTTTDSTVGVTNSYAMRHYQGVLDGLGLSFRYKFDDDHAMAISVRGRTYNHFRSNNFLYEDSQKSLSSFLKANLSNPVLDFYFIHAGWVETNINYSEVVYKTTDSKLSFGANLSINKALSGAYGAARDVQYKQLNNPTTGKTYYQPTKGEFIYQYSGNLSLFDTVKVSSQSIKDFYKSSHTSLGLSIGLEYLLNDENSEEELNNSNYQWKLGAAIMDIGSLKFDYANGSSINSKPNLSYTDTILDSKFKHIPTLGRFRDSFSTMFDKTDTLNGTFKINLPTRMVLSINRNLGGGFYVNFEASLNFNSTRSQKRINTREINLFTLTPRWESQLFGVYMPVQYNSEGNLWFGAAIKIGPLIMGIHDFSVFGWSKKQDQNINSGGYVMLNVYPYKSKKRIDGELKCPPKL